MFALSYDYVPLINADCTLSDGIMALKNLFIGHNMDLDRLIGQSNVNVDINADLVCSHRPEWAVLAVN